MATKINLTITPDTEYLDPTQIDATMMRTITTLQRLGIIPLRKLTLAIECKDEDAEDVEDTIDAALSARPVGIEVVLKTTRERHVTRDTLAPVTPMDEMLREPEVTLSGGGRSVTLTAETRRNATAALRNMPVSSDREPR